MSIDPRDLLDQALELVKKDLEALAKKKERSTAEMGALSRYVKDLHSVAKTDEAESLAVQRELSKLPMGELEELARGTLGVVPVSTQALSDALATAKKKS